MPTAVEHPPSALAPWVNRGEAYWFFLPTPSSSLPGGAYDPLEGNAFYGSPEAGAFRPKYGMASAQVVRYTDSPAGPYDELAYFPGLFDTPSGRAQARTTRIYVSTDESIYNGRKNWNIPKHLARFSFIHLEPGSKESPVKIDVFAPSSDKAFFSAIVKPSSWLPSFPLNTRYLPMETRVTHPPLPNSGPDAYSVVGTDEWISIHFSMRGKAEFVWYTPGGGEKAEAIGMGEYADGVGFPKINPRPLGLHLKNLILEFPVGERMENRKTK